MPTFIDAIETFFACMAIASVLIFLPNPTE